VPDAKRLKQLKEENARLKKLLAEAMLDNAVLKGHHGKKAVTPAARKAAVTVAHGISERRACLIIGADRSAMCYRHQRSDDAATTTRLKELAAERPRFGRRRLKLLLEREGIRMNHVKLR
jgi:hypothetical protein